MLDFQAARWLIAQEVPKQAGNDHPTSIPTGVFKTTGRLHQHCRRRTGAIGAAGRATHRRRRELLDDYRLRQRRQGALGQP